MGYLYYLFIFDLLSFRIRQLTPLASCKRRIEWDPCEIYTFEINDLIANRLEHTLDLMEFPLSYGNFARAIREKI